MSLIEGNLDGIVGPTHNYAGLAFGNEASLANAGSVSNPRAAALQGLQKMQTVMQLGIPQMVMPPHPRPNVHLLGQLGFRGHLREQIASVARQAPQLLPYAYSAAGMWVANAATVAPSVDTPGGYAHFTPANLIATAHRAPEAAFVTRALKRLFPDEKHFAHHAPLPANLLFADEGAANHMRLGLPDGKGLHVFVYGRDEASFGQKGKYPARHSLQASQAVARLHGLDTARTFFIRQHPEAIDAGIFHNDVIATSHENMLLYHERGYGDNDASVEALERAAGGALCIIRVSEKQLPLSAAVQTYIFNSQIVSIPHGGMLMLAPAECKNHPQASALIASICADPDNPIREAHFLDLRESMRNGGGPACLRLRIPIDAKAWQCVHQGAVLTQALYEKLVAWVNAHYRDRLASQDLADPKLAEESLAALAALEDVLDLRGIYDF